MKRNSYALPTIALIVVLLISSCTSQPAENVEEGESIEEAQGTATIMEVPVEDETDIDLEDESSTEEPSTQTSEPELLSVETPDWFDVTLVDVRTGQPFTMNDFQGKVVLVETLAMWCSSCLQQQVQVKTLKDRLSDRDDFVSVGLDIDVNENADDLKAYTENNGFDWLYAIAPVEVAREISNRYGAQFLNPPSTPILVIDKSGQVHLMPFGIKSADTLKDFISPFLSNGM
jgi:cytochrome oxidase Cu insertion factor (SCO1/SenC/PrrC family)